jgi:circadian clock protein KaiB
MTEEERPDQVSLLEFERALAARDTARYILVLFVSGASVLSSRAIATVRELCDTHLVGRFDLQVVDVRHEPELVRNSGVVASPTLIKTSPPPRRVLVGDLSDTVRLRGLLGIDPGLSPGVGGEADV